MRHNAFHRGLAVSLFLGALGLMNACTNANLSCSNGTCSPAAPADLDNKLTFEGQVCTANPNSVDYPYKILFVVDVSGSTVDSDPTNQRGPAVQAVLEQYQNNPEVSFAIISFDTQPNVLEPTFTRDLNVLLPIIPQLNLNKQDTNYLDTLQEVASIISADANSLTATERSRTRYDIEWLSDGVPEPCAEIPQVLDAEETPLKLTSSLGLFDVRLSTIFLMGAPNQPSNCPDMYEPDALMMQMATPEGRGTYQALTGANLKFNIQFSTISQPFTSQLVYVVNQSRVVKNDQLLPDSDQDGVADADEKTYGLDPTKPDSLSSGCGDKIQATEALNPNLCQAICSAQNPSGNPNSLLDQDADTLHDCAEQSLSINRTKADSDGDNLIDPLEIRFGTNANDPGTLTADTDDDGMIDADEIKNGLDPLTPQANKNLAYVYAPLTAATAPKPGLSCFNFNVSNVQLVQTAASSISNAGDNRICMYMEQLPQGDSSATSEPTVSRACTTANFKVVNGSGEKTPGSGVVTFNPNDFTPYICASGTCLPTP